MNRLIDIMTMDNRVHGLRLRKSAPPGYLLPAKVLISIITVVFLATVFSSTTDSAEIYIDRQGSVQIDINDLTDGASNNSSNDGLVADFNKYIARTDAVNPIEWVHQWDLATPSDGNIPTDADEVFTNSLAGEIFVVVWDVDYPSDSEHDILFWDDVAYAGPSGAGFTAAANPGAENLGRLQGSNNTWGAKRISLDPTKLAPGQTEYFWLQVDEDPGGTAWKSSIDYADLAIVFNEGKLAISKSMTVESGFDPPRVGHTTYFLIRIDISNPTLTSSGGPVYDTKVTDTFAAGSTIVTNPTLGSAVLTAGGALTWNVGILQDGALNTPPAADSTAYMVVRVAVTPTLADLGNPIMLNAGATISGGQVPEDPGDGTGSLYPFNYFSAVASETSAVSALLVTPTMVIPATTGTISSTANIIPSDTITITVTDTDLDTNSGAPDTVTITVVNTNTGESESITLTETGSSTGVFTATLPTLPGTAAGTNNDGTMNVANGNVIRATYNDQADANGVAASPTSDTTVVDNSNSITLTGPTGTKTTTTHNVTGTTDPYSTVTLTDPITCLPLTATADASGNYTFNNVTFPQGTTNYTVTSTDPSGNTATTFTTVKVDSINSINISSPIIGSVINSTSPAVSGTTDPNATVTIVEPSTGNTLTTTADATGNYSFASVGLNIGANNLTVTSTDPSGNVATSTGTVTVDQSIALSTTSITNGTTYATTTITLSGTTDPGSTVTTTDPTTGALLTTVADGAGNYSFGNLTFPEGTTTQTVNATDPSGNSTSSSVSLTVDTTNTATITTSSISTSTSVNVTGTTDPLSTVTFQSPITGQTFTTTADAAGNYAFTNVFMPDGTYTITTTSTDPVGNVSTTSQNITVQSVNTIAASVTPGNSVANTPSLPITGTTTAGSTVTVTDPVNGTVYTTTADANGNFSFAGINLAAGVNTITIVSTDPNGVSVSQTSNITYDLNVSLNVQSPQIGAIAVSPVQTLTGTTIPNGTVTITDPVTGAVLTATADANGNYTLPNVNFPQGTTTLTVTASDGLGHSVSTTNIFSVAANGVDATITASENTVQGEPIFIEVTDKETYRNSSTIDTIQVTVVNLDNNDTEVCTLIETGPATGVFKGRMNTSVGVAGTQNNNVLTVKKGDTVKSSFTDPIKADGTLNAVISDNTDITNDALKITVNVYTVTTTGSATKELSSTSISILEYDSSGNLTGKTFNYTTASTGLIPAEFISCMRSDMEYRVLVNDSVDGYPYSQSESFTLADLEAAPVDANGVRIYSLALDPAGFVYDALTGARVDGTIVTLYHQGGTAVVGPFAIFTQDPLNTQTNPQLSGDSGMPGGFEFIGSGATTDLTAGYYYIEVTFTANSILDTTYFPITHSNGSWSGISEPYAGEEFLVNLQNQPIGMRVPLYRRAANSLLSVSKTVDRAFAASGDIVIFSITVRNQGSQTDPNNPVEVKDTMQPGLKFIDGSAYLSTGAPVQTTVSTSGTLTFSIGRLDTAGAAGGGDVAVISYMATVDSSARPGMVLSNSAYAEIAGAILSNTAVASIRVTDDPVFDRATLIGRVFLDANENGRFDRCEKGLGGVGLIMEDGTYITTGPEGKYSVPGADTGHELTGTRVIKIDLETLPFGTTLTTSESVFATLRPGDIDKANFGVVLPPDLMPLDHSDSIQVDKLFDKFTFSNYFVLLAEAVGGDFDSGAEPRTDTEFFPSGGFARGRVAYFFALSIKEELNITSYYDSHKSHTYDISREVDPDAFYPSYGDGSSVRYLAQTQGRFYLRASSRRGNLVVGNYDVLFPRTELAGVRRALSGVKLELNSIDGDSGRGDRFVLFSTRRKQLHSRTELRATGGTNFYLANTKIVPGSERITVQIRDSIIPEKVVFEYTLAKDVDYDIDYTSGRLRLFRPVAAFSNGETLYHYGLENGDPAWIVAEYSFTPEQNDLGSFGGRYLHETGQGFSVGASYVRENYDGSDHMLHGFDFHVGPEDDERLSIEYARSQSGGLPRYASFDAGRSFLTLGSRGTASGNALKCRFTIKEIPNLEWENYYYLVDPTFSGPDFGTSGVKRAGTSLVYGTDTHKWFFDYTRADTQIGAGTEATFNAGGGRTRTLRFGYKEKFNFGDLSAEYLRDYNSGDTTGTTGVQSGAVDSIAARYERKLNEKVTLLAGQQVTLNTTRQHNRTTLGVRVAVSDRISFTVEGAAGTDGTGGRLGFERSSGSGGSGAKTYVNVTTGREQAGEGREISTAAGYSKPVSDKTDIYLQMETRSRTDETTRGRTLGLNHDFEISRVMQMSLSVERTEESSSLQGRYFTNSVTWSGDYSVGKTSAEAGAEYRTSKGATHKRYYGGRFALDAPFNSRLSSFLEYDYEISETPDTEATESKYTKALAGLAWRPPYSDRLNLLARTGRIRELRTLSVNDTLNPDTVATVLSLEGIFDLSHDFRLRVKSASKQIRESITSGPAGRTHTLLHIAGITWQPSDTSYLRMEYRTLRQPTQLNFRNGILVETGRYIKDSLRIGIGYNFSTHTDDEFTVRDESFRGFYFTISGKM